MKKIEAIWAFLEAVLLFVVPVGLGVVKEGFARGGYIFNILMSNVLLLPAISLLFWLLLFGVTFDSGVPSVLIGSFWDVWLEVPILVAASSFVVAANYGRCGQKG